MSDQSMSDESMSDESNSDLPSSQTVSFSGDSGHDSSEPRTAEVGSSADFSLDSVDRTTAAAKETARNSSGRQPKIENPFQVGDLVEGRFQIEALLGEGGFGAVYSASDQSLARRVAIKYSKGLQSFVDGSIRNEAQSIASLSHPNIVSVYDLLTLRDGHVLIVMEYLQGSSLQNVIRQNRPSIDQSVDIGVQIAMALQHAHSRELVHSDLKPGNLFVLDSGLVKLLDFGLAVASFPDQPPEHTGGTPGYMSPEQIRGESHRIDGRADIWAFGVVLYELLCGTRPFPGRNAKQVYEATLRKEVPPLRQLNPDIDEDLQRLVLKCLQKRRIDRYDSATSLLEDLQHWQKKKGTSPPTGKGASLSSEVALVAAQQDEDVSKRPESGSRSALTPRGLQPFTEDDSRSYLDLIPGPRDRSGIPESLVFWKRWVQSNDVETDYPVGVIYGPSGSGKTSYVRAGLLAQLDPDICRVYVECRPGDLGGRLTRIVESRTDVASRGSSSLRDLLHRIRSDSDRPKSFRKLLIVLDQFEVWSHTASLQERMDFADALRQCDGIQIRVLVVTRDDYWSGVRELMQWLEIPLQEGRNVAAVDLLDFDSAFQILELIGRSSGALPADDVPLSNQQVDFLRQSINELSQHNRVICVHLVMFAQMMRLQSWTPKSLRGSGGVAGACSLFFQELFERGGSGPPECRRIADVAVIVLSELLPDVTESVDDAIRSRDQLAKRLQATGKVSRLDDTLQVLVESLRIVTVVADDPFDDSPADSAQPVSFRLAHNFLIQPIRSWLDRAERKTWRGRTLSRLGELSSTWEKRNSKSLLPGFSEYLALMAATRFHRVNDSESKFIRAATRYHAGRISMTLLAIIGMFATSLFAWTQYRDAKAARQSKAMSDVDLLLNGDADQVSTRIEGWDTDRELAESFLSNAIDSTSARARWRARLWMASEGKLSAESLIEEIGQADVSHFPLTLRVMSEAKDAETALKSFSTSDAEIDARVRAALLSAELGQPELLQELLDDDDDAATTETIIDALKNWPGSLKPFVELLSGEYPSHVRYHAAIVLHAMPLDAIPEKQALRQASEELLTEDSVLMHHTGLMLQSKLRGEDEDAIDPPANRPDWPLALESIPMVRVEPQSYEHSTTIRGLDNQREITTERPIYFASRPVPVSFFRDYLRTNPELPSESLTTIIDYKKPSLEIFQAGEWHTPLIGLRMGDAIEFVNWLSRQEGLKPRYERSETAFSHIPKDFRESRYIPYRLVDGDGYRFPTGEEFIVVAFSGYSNGIPWDIAKLDPSTESLLKTVPNRSGIFLNAVYDCAFVHGRPKTPSFRIRPKNSTPYGGTYIPERVELYAYLYLVRDID